MTNQPGRMAVADLRIRVADPDDVDVLTDFNCRLALETERKILDPVTVRNGVTRGLSVGEEVQYWVADEDGVVAGQLMLTREWSDWRDGWMYWLQSVYVVAERRGQGVFRRLLEHVMQQLRNRTDVCCLRLYVEDENHAAMESYRRLGFEEPGYRVMEVSLQQH
ncbi:MAG: GNAT family N-acetyltransferase [Planctomycetaceae bacterium]